MTPATYKKIGVASLIMMASAFLSRVIGIIREMVIAGFGGVGWEVDAYQVAFIIPEILNHLVASGFLSLTFIPIFSHYLTQNREEEGWRIFSIILTCFGIILAVLIFIAELYTGPLVNLLAPGIDSLESRDLIIRMTRIILPAQFFFFSGGLLMAVQFAKGKFLIPALAPLLYNMGIIAGGLILGTRLGIEGFAWGVLAGAVTGNFLVQVIGAKRLGMRFSPSLAIKHPDLRKYILLTVPLMVGLTPAFSIELLFRFFGSFLPTGGIASINYSLRIMLVVVGLFGQAVATAFFPFMSRLVAENNLEEANRLLNRTLRYLSLALPIVALLMVLRVEVVTVLFQRGAFGPEATALTARVLLFLLPGSVAIATYTLVLRGFYAMQNTLFPAVFSTLAVLLSLPFYYFGMRAGGPQGIAVAMSLSTIVQALLLYISWNIRTRNRGSRKVYLSFLNMVILSIGTGLLFEWGIRLFSGDSRPAGFFQCMTVIALTGTAGLGLIIGIGYLLRMKEIIEPLEKIRTAALRRIFTKG